MSYYIIRNNGFRSDALFKDPQDYSYFIACLKRYLGAEISVDKTGRKYKNLREDVQLLAFGLVPNEFELLIYLGKAEALPRLMRGIATAYSAYYNERYSRYGPLFPDRYEALELQSSHEALPASRYVMHLPIRLSVDGFTSLSEYLDPKDNGLIATDNIFENLENTYIEYYSESTASLDYDKFKVMSL